MKTVFVNRFFFPDEVATSLMLTDLSVALSEQGRDVRVVCSRMQHAAQRLSYSPSDQVKGVAVHRVWTTALGRFGLMGRALDSLTFHVMVFFHLLRLLAPGDCVVAKTDPPLLGVTVALAGRLRGARWVNWLQDVFPEVAPALGVAIPRLLFSLLTAMRNWGLRHAQCNVVLGVRMRERLLVTVPGLQAQQVDIIPNWSRDRRMDAQAFAGAAALRQRWKLQDRFVVCYSGNLGRAHEFETFLRAAQLIQNEPRFADLASRIVWVFIGGGAGRAGVEQAVQRMGLGNVQLLPSQPVESLSASLAVADVHLVSLLPAAEGLIVPSKYYGVASAARACAFVGDVRGELALILGQADAGAAFAVGDAQGLAQWLVGLSRQPAELERLGGNARRWLEVNGSFALALERWNHCLYRPAAVSHSFRGVVV